MFAELSQDCCYTRAMFKSRTLAVACLLIWPMCWARQLYAQQNEELTPLSTSLLILSKLDRDSYRFEEAQRQIVRAYCQRQDFSAALEMANQVDRSQRVEVLSYLALRTLEAHDSAITNKVLKVALELLPDVDANDNSDFGRAPELVDIALNNDDPELALKFIAKSDRGARKADAFSKVAEYFEKRADKENAIRYLESALAESAHFEADESDYLFDLTTKSATIFSKLGFSERTAELVRNARELVGSNPVNQDGLAIMFARLGDYSQAVGIMESMNGHKKLSTMISLSSVYRDGGDERTALALLTEARRIGIERERDQYSVSKNAKTLAQAYLKIDRGDEALELLPRITDNYDLRNAAIDVAGWFQSRKRTADARQALDIATKCASLIVSEKSEDIPASASTSSAQRKSRDLTALVEAYVRIDDPSSAETAARAIDQPQYRASALALAGSSFAKAGESVKAAELLADALKLSERSVEYNHDTFREYALYQIAKAAGEAGLRDFASKAMEAFFRTLITNDSYDVDLGTLFEMGLEAQVAGIPVNKESGSLLKRIIYKVQGDQ